MASFRLKPLAVIQLSCLIVLANGFALIQYSPGDDDPTQRPGETSQNRGLVFAAIAGRRSNGSELNERFDCGNGNSVPEAFLCDGDNDCRNGADERNCTHERFDCGNGHSVPKAFLCDRDNDCRNGADERNCTHENPVAGTTENPVAGTTDSPVAITTADSPVAYITDSRVSSVTDGGGERIVEGLFFYCGNNRYVRLRSLCDGNDDCGNLADERLRRCNQEPVTARYGGAMFLKEDARIKSPNFPQDYPQNLKVIWNVTTVPGHRIKLDFIVKELEMIENCIYDRLSLYDGQQLSPPPLGVYCSRRSELPEPAVSSSNAMVVQFKSDISVSRRGFDLALSTVCGGTLLVQTSENELLSHTKFGDDTYGQNISCDWIIKSRPERNVQIRFSVFDVGIKLHREVNVSGCENSVTENCVQYNAGEENALKDFVEIYDGPVEDSSKRIGKYAGDQTPPTITSRGEELLIRFRSGDTGSFRGFRAIYQEV